MTFVGTLNEPSSRSISRFLIHLILNCWYTLILVQCSYLRSCISEMVRATKPSTFKSEVSEARGECRLLSAKSSKGKWESVRPFRVEGLRA